MKGTCTCRNAVPYISGLSSQEWTLYFSWSLFSSIEQNPPPAVAEWEVQQCRLSMCTHRAHIKAKGIQCFKLALFECILHSRDDFLWFWANLPTNEKFGWILSWHAIPTCLLPFKLNWNFQGRYWKQSIFQESYHNHIQLICGHGVRIS